MQIIDFSSQQCSLGPKQAYLAFEKAVLASGKGLSKKNDRNGKKFV